MAVGERGCALLRLACLLPTAGAWNLLGALGRNDLTTPAATSAAPTLDGVTRVAQLRVPVVQDPPPKTRTTAPPPEARVWVEGESVLARVGHQSFTLLQGLGPGIHAADPSAAGGAFLSLGGLADRSEHRISLGALECERLLAGARTKRWWMGPTFGAAADDVPAETQFLLLELSPHAYAVMLPLVRAPLRCTLDGSKGGGELQLLCQSGDTAVRARAMDDALYLSVGEDPFELLSEAFACAPPPPPPSLPARPSPARTARAPDARPHLPRAPPRATAARAPHPTPCRRRRWRGFAGRPRRAWGASRCVATSARRPTCTNSAGARGMPSTRR